MLHISATVPSINNLHIKMLLKAESDHRCLFLDNSCIINVSMSSNLIRMVERNKWTPKSVPVLKYKNAYGNCKCSGLENREYGRGDPLR
jgi:hypothetical protein